MPAIQTADYSTTKTVPQMSEANVKVQLTPFPQKVPGIIACGYYLPMGQSTTLVVTADEAKKLQALSERSVMNPKTKKLEARARFSFARLGDTPGAVSPKLKGPRLGVAQVPTMEIPHEEHIKALIKNSDATQKVIDQLPELLKTLKKG